MATLSEVGRNLNVLISRDMFSQTRIEAAKSDISISEFVRRAIKRELKREKRDNERL